MNALELKNITKTFGAVYANKNVSIDVKQGEILSILGENGSGKTTLMNMVAGIYFPDEGQIFVNGKEVVIKSPKDAFDNKIGMIHQHFKLVDVFTVLDNIILGAETTDKLGFLKKKEAREKEVRENDDRCGCGSGSSGNWNCSSTAADGGSEKNGDCSFRKRKF